MFVATQAGPATVACAAGGAHIRAVDFQAMLVWIEAHPGTAAWVQGIGTLLAIIVAAVTAVLQIRAGRRDQMRRAVAELQARREAAALITATVAKVVLQFSKTIGQKDHLDALPLMRTIDRSVEGYLADLALIPLSDLRDEPLIDRVLAMRSHILMILEMLESLRIYLKRGGSAKDEIGSRVQAIGSSGAAVDTAAEEFRQRLDILRRGPTG
jgi:hypothetical protein